MLFDTHCHLDASEFGQDRAEVVAAAQSQGVSTILIPSVNTGNFPAVRSCCERFTGCLPAYGIHPLYVGTASEGDLEALRTWLQRESEGPLPPVAVGEIGLDYYVPNFDAFRQEHFFNEQLKIAASMHLPVLLHVRRAIDQVLKCLRRSDVRRGIAHAFNGSRQQAEEFIALGFQLGFGGAMTHPGATRIRLLAASLPLDAIVLETDAPDIPPAWLAGSLMKPRNTPDQLPRIAAVLAELRGMEVTDVIQATATNASRCLGVPL